MYNTPVQCIYTINHVQYSCTLYIYNKSCTITADCAAGEYWDEHSVSCTKCPKDSYQPELYKSTCLKCPEGQFTDDTGAVTDSQCKGKKNNVH